MTNSAEDKYMQGKVALVTGANRGIGKAIVGSFLAHGASKVYLAVRNPESTAELAQEFGDKVVTLQADVSDDASVQRLAKQAQDVDIVVNNAGILAVADPLAAEAQQALQREFNVNVFGLLRVAQAFSPLLVAKGRGALVQLNSIASLKNFTPFSTYSASKAASYSLTQGLRDVLAAKGVQVLSVHPGPIATDMASQAGFDQADPVSMVSEGIVSALASGDFQLFPDTMAKQFGEMYQSFADNIINADLSE